MKRDKELQPHIEHLENELANLDYMPQYHPSRSDRMQGVKYQLARMIDAWNTSGDHPTVKKMRGIVQRHIAYYLTDFYCYDLPDLADHDPTDEFIWIVRKAGTFLLWRDTSDEVEYRHRDMILAQCRADEVHHRFYAGSLSRGIHKVNPRNVVINPPKEVG